MKSLWRVERGCTLEWCDFSELPAQNDAGNSRVDAQNKGGRKSALVVFVGKGAC
jgi:hypothetical protein